ncbi:hypothetical protein ACA910_002855 [Epithemia clementina (nom. ined.)]
MIRREKKRARDAVDTPPEVEIATATPCPPPTRNIDSSTDSTPRPLIQQLSESCNKHQAYHKTKALENISFEKEDDVPSFCREALKILKRLLPRVEKHYRAAQSGHQGPAPLDVRHMCDFYCNVISGGFCIHAPHLLRRGKGATGVLPRVFYLIQHAVSLSITSHTIAEERQNSEVTVADTIVVTLARLLKLIPGTRFEFAIVRDLVQMIRDLGVLKQCDERILKDGIVDLILFQSTTIESDDPDNTEFSIELTSLEVVAALESTLTSVLSLFLSYQRNSQLYPPDDFSESTQHGFGPSNAYFAGLVGDPALQSDLASSLCQNVLQVQWHQDDRLGSFELHAQRSALASLTLSHFLLLDCDSGLLQPSVALHVNLMVAKASLLYLASTSSEVSEATLSPSRRTYADGLSRLMRKAFVLGKTYRCMVSMERTSSSWSLHKATFPILVDCVRFLYRTSGSDVVLTHRKLSTTVLESIACISNDRQEVNFDPFSFLSYTDSYCGDFCQNIFRAVRDPKLAKLAFSILVTSMTKNATTLYSRIKRLCSFVLSSDQTSGKSDSTLNQMSLDQQSFLNPPCKKRLKTFRATNLGQRVCDNWLVELVSEALMLATSVTAATNKTEPCLVTVSLQMLTFIVRDTPKEIDDVLKAMAACIEYVSTWLGQCSDQETTNRDREALPFVLTTMVHIVNAGMADVASGLSNELDSVCVEVFASCQRGRIATRLSTAENDDIIERIYQLGRVPQLRTICLEPIRKLLRLDHGGVNFSHFRSVLAAEDVVARSRAWVAAFSLDQYSDEEQVDVRRLLTMAPLLSGKSSVDENKSPTEFLLDSLFGEKDGRLCDYSSRQIGKLLLTSKPCLLVPKVAENDDLSSGTEEEPQDSATDSTRLVEASVTRLFQLVDRLFGKFNHGSVPPVNDASRYEEAAGEILLGKRAAIRCLVSMCEACDLGTETGRSVFECAVLRLVQMWSTTDDNYPFECAGLCFAEMCRLLERLDVGTVIRTRLLSYCAPSLFGAALMPTTSNSVDLRYQRMSSLLGVFPVLGLPDDQDVNDVSLVSLSTTIRDALTDCLPSVLARMILETNYEALSLTAGYKLFNLAREQTDGKIETKRSPLLSYLSPGDKQMMQRKLKRPWMNDLDNQVFRLTQAPGIVERMLPHVMQHANKRELLFLVTDVLRGKRDLHILLSGRDQLMLKGFVKALGQCPNKESSIRALLLAAKAREEPSFIHSFDETITMATDQKSSEAASSWVSSHFMYLLVNVVQSRWCAKETWEKTEDLRSLFLVLDFIHASDKTVAQCLPQMMATLNGAIAQNVVDESSSLLVGKLRLWAVRCMSKFIKLVSLTNWDIVGENLASLVASLLPVLAQGEESQVEKKKLSPEATPDPELVNIIFRSKSYASSIIKFLSEGDLGMKLAPFFADVSFLFQLPSLGRTNTSLVRGTNSEAFSPAGKAALVDESSSKHSAQSDVESCGSSTGQEHQTKQTVLRQHLEAIVGLISHEDAGVRQVVLQHLTILVRRNRDSFYALVDNESGASTRHFLTVSKARNSRGIITELIESLLSRCAFETDQTQRLLLASCLGEIGAIAEYKLNDTILSSGSEDYSGTDAHVWRLSKPPWKIQPRVYGLQLVKGELVRSLRAGLSSADQHKIGFAIQQLLSLLQGDSTKDSKMASWLSQELSDAGVLELVEPFWQTEFHEQTYSQGQRQPPFFPMSTSYLSWISNWCRHMISRARNSQNRGWSEIFYACRTALRTQYSNVAEFILPVLVLDRLCFGDAVDEQVVVQEMTDVLTLKEPSMKTGDSQLAVNAIFTIVDTFQFWLEQDVEERCRRVPTADTNSGQCEWRQDESTMRIEDILERVPFPMQARAAGNVGMNARSLRLFEMASRSSVADIVYGAVGSDSSGTLRTPFGRSSRAAGVCPADCIEQMKGVLSSLDDHETLVSLSTPEVKAQHRMKIQDSIREKVALQDWSGVLQEHERALQMESDVHEKVPHQKGLLECLLELGQYESVLNQVGGITSSDPGWMSGDSLVPYAVQAAWRLGRWDTLSAIANESRIESAIDPDGKYHLCLGNALLAVQKRHPTSAFKFIEAARISVMDRLATASRDSYTRSYEQIVRLRSLQEVEEFVRSSDDGKLPYNLSQTMLGDWKRRLEVAAPESAVGLINVRLALSRLAKDPATEGQLFLAVGKQARKTWTFHVAEYAFARADEAFSSARSLIQITDICTLRLEQAKLKHQIGESSDALRLLDIGDIGRISQLDSAKTLDEVTQRVASITGVGENDIDKDGAVEVFVHAALKSLKWTIASGLKGGNEILSGFRVIHRLAPEWEKAHFRFAKYVEEVMQSRVTLLQRRASPHSFSGSDGLSWGQILSKDRTCQKFLFLAVKHYSEALKVELKHLYQALPRLLSLWFQFTSISGEINESQNALHTQTSVGDVQEGTTNQRHDSQMQLNEFMAQNFRSVPPQAFYSAIAQLVSRLTHPNSDTRTIVCEILKRVLTKFPEQAMWHLAWLVHSKDTTRRDIAQKIFASSTTALINQNNQYMSKVLVASQSLFKYLYDLARYGLSKNQRKTEITVRSWQSEVALSAFIPPVQAALCLSHSQCSNVKPSTVFSRQAPRMRAFSRKLQIMQSKARPKKITAFAVSWDPSIVLDPTTSALDSDIGEMHFLIKQEVEGDLRKDARVQDLNNVINRLMMTHNTRKGMRPRRGLRLRTFAVTCLSEETGIVEWVASTKSVRSVVEYSYNPMAPPASSKRRGARMTTVDATMKHTFEKKCQDTFLVNGDLRRAAALFEELCLKPHPPLLYWWFVHTFPNPHLWFEARTRFTQSAAAWSAVGHVIGLGDRHAENILLDTTSGEVVHVDFDCIFDKGLSLPRPEIVPFRLTSNLVDAFGPAGADGVFAGSLNDAMSTLRKQSTTLVSVLEPFLNDPVIEWKKSRSQQPQMNAQLKEAKRSINVIDERLRGIYNLRNPNFKKVRRTDTYTERDDDELTQVMPLSVEGQVHKLIAEATSSENLVQLYFGWMPWI